MRHDRTRRVLVTEGEGRAALAAVRSLAAHGYDVTTVAAQRPAAAQWSRASARGHRLPDPRADAPGFVAGLAELLAARPHLTVVPGSDAALLAISAHREQLADLTDLALPPDAVVTSCVDKVALADTCRAAGLDAPQGGWVEGTEAAVALARELGYPVIAKPRSTVWVAGGHVHQRGGRAAADEASLRAQLPALGGACVVQRAETGALFSCSGVMAGGALLAVALSRYERTWPPDGGNAAAARTVAPDPGLTDRVQRMLAGIGWEGIFELELIGTPDGRMVAIDLNPRIFGSLSLVVAAGAPLPVVWCDWLRTGRPPFGGDRPVRARAGVRYRWEDAELKYVAWQLKHRRLRAAIAACVPHRTVVHAHFTRRDPLPIVARAVYLLRSRRPGR